MNIIPFKGKNLSSHDKLNLLFQDGKTFIMDNHLAGSWCWLRKIDTSSQYNLLHIDRHYDLLESQIEWWVEELQNQRVDLANISIEGLLAIKYKMKNYDSAEFQLIRWDNYITIFNRLYPKDLDLKYFATHRDGSKIENFKMYEPPIYELQDNLAYYINESASQNKWIVNLDVDYFFIKRNGKCYQFLTDEYVISIAREIRKSWDKIEVLTIALSPECCGSWENAIRIAKLIADEIGIKWSISELT